jgi:lipoyl(octanoyl) transferase
MSYPEACALQAGLIAQRRRGEVGDTLLLLEHPHVITLGASSRHEHLLADAEERTQRSIELFETGRGGGVTYHGPGQLVGYPILDLKPDRKDVHAYLRDLEEVLIRACGALGVPAGRSAQGTGVWTAGGKVAAIGVRVSSGWITSHGFALNVRTDLSYFETIVPWGIQGAAVTSLEREVGRPVSLEEAEALVVASFREVFDAPVV